MDKKITTPDQESSYSKTQNNDSSPIDLREIFPHVQPRYLPPAGSPAHVVLSILSDGKEHPKFDLLLALEDDPRSPLQALRNEQYGFWLIHNLGCKKAVYQLDRAHLSGNPSLDMYARAKERVALKTRSRTQAENEAQRLDRAKAQEIKAKENLARAEVNYD